MAGIASPLSLSPAPSNTGNARSAPLAHPAARATLKGFDVVSAYRRALEDDKVPHPIAAILALVELMEASTASTVTGLASELTVGRQALINTQTSLGVRAGCQLWERFFAVFPGVGEEFPAFKRSLISQGRSFCSITAPQCRERIAELAVGFLRDDCVILTHSYSRTVMQTILRAHQQHKRIRVYVTEARPGCLGMKTHQILTANGIPCEVVLDSAVAYVMERVDMVLVGSEAVVESGGLVSSVGTYQVALTAKVMQKPFYALAESYKFLRHYPLSQTDLPMPSAASSTAAPSAPSSVPRSTIPLEFNTNLPNAPSLFQPTAPLSRPSSQAPQSRAPSHPPAPQAPATPPQFSGRDGDGGKPFTRTEMTKEMEENNPMVDVTTPDLIDFIITDLGAPLSPTSVSQYLVAQFSS
ncbi:translation initiation factor eIF-2B subunit alpha [Cryptococcus wingfieldii CBS 7118]|uniref:Translation initiation factor eIF2B subunit alpha n=1 Tax=Cryptococcus wingfieldii CBS 7118 TaxID=1295528 RepID=A0A1E3JZE9_9TREE|nr:translation initiation factor eIF-2B subunit alpha [Cryptococcus wingfieldii CBS 7118]ODO06166.1 translation initiation factor eIF-2B subunit alpha [Cryptococcus wingfieldii CBS 7118]